MVKKLYNGTGQEVSISDLNITIPSKHYLTLSDDDFNKSKDVKTMVKLNLLREIRNFFMQPFTRKSVTVNEAVEQKQLTVNPNDLEEMIRRVVSSELKKMCPIVVSEKQVKDAPDLLLNNSIKKRKSKDELVFVRPDTEEMQGELNIQSKVQSDVSNIIDKLKNLKESKNG